MSVELDIRLKRGAFELSAKLQVPAGLTVIFGPSGSGKTTLLRAIAGLNLPDCGTIYIDGSDMSVAPPFLRSVGYVFQDARLLPHLDIAGNLDFPKKMGRNVSMEARSQVIELLELGPLLSRSVKDLSGGEAQRVSLGRALLSAPKCLCMDEPLSALDHGLRQRIIPFLERLRDQTRIPIIYVTHDASEMARLADHIVLMQNGQTVMSGLASEILSNPAAVPILGVRAAGTVISVKTLGLDAETGLASVAFSGGQLLLPDTTHIVGRDIRLRIAAQDIVLAKERPRALSALNILKGKITGFHRGQNSGVMVQFKVGDTVFLARVTAYSAKKMGLVLNQKIFAIVKASAFDPAGVGT